MTIGVKFTIGALAAVLVLMTSGCVGGDEEPFISAGAQHTCGVQNDGSLACWGYDADGQVSGPNGSTGTFGFPPQQLSNLASLIEGYGFQSNLEKKLLNKVKAIQKAYTQGNTAAACQALSSMYSLVVSEESKNNIKAGKASLIKLLIRGLESSVECQ